MIKKIVEGLPEINCTHCFQINVNKDTANSGEWFYP